MNGSKVKRGIISVIIIGLITISVPTNTVFAEGEEGSVKRASLNEIIVNTEIMEETVESNSEVNNESYVLVPGSFYYLVKQTLETIQLRLAFTEESRLMLYTQFASDKLDAAYELIEQENYDGAEQVLEEALDYHAAAMEVEVKLDTAEEEDSLEGLSDDGREDFDFIDDVTLEKLEENKVHQSIKSLVKNIKKIDNPNAKAALTRNVERKLSKLGISMEDFFDSETKEVNEQNDSAGIEEVDSEEITIGKKESTKSENNRGHGREHAPGQLKEKNKKEMKVESKSKGASNGNKQRNGNNGNGKNNGNGNNKN